MRTKHNRGAAVRTQMIDEQHRQDFLQLNCIKSSCSPHRLAFTLSLVRCVCARVRVRLRLISVYPGKVCSAPEALGVNTHS